MGQTVTDTKDPNWGTNPTDPNWGLNADSTHPEARMSAAVPGTALPADDPNVLRGALGPKVRGFLDKPLVNTGVEGLDSLTTPANLTVTALIGAASARAAAVPAGNALAKAKAAMAVIPAHVGGIVKYEVAKAVLEGLHVPPYAAAPIAMIFAGHQGGGKSGHVPIPENVGRPKAWGTPLELTQAMKPKGEALEAAKREAFASMPPAAPKPVTPVETAAPAPAPTAAPAPVATPPGATTADATAAMWRNLRAAGLRPTEAQTAARLLGQGVPLPEVEARVLANRPSAPSVADLSPVQKAVNIKPGVEPSTAQITNGLGLAARRAKVPLSAEDLDLLKPLVKQGMTPEDAIKGLPALKMQGIPGTMTDAEVAAEIAARKGNRSPKRD